METIYRIYEDDYGCEERPENEPDMVIVCLQDDRGAKRYLRIEERLLLQNALEEGSCVQQDARGRLLPADTTQDATE